jgi:hypothetical protein
MTGATNVTPHASEPVEGSRPELQTMSLIDLHLPRYQFVQRHTTYVVAPPDRILDTILSGALAGAWLDEDRLMRALVALRFALDRLTKPGGGSHRSNSSFSLQSFTFLGRQDDREIAIGLAGRFWRLTGAVLPPFPDAAHFAAFSEPGVPKLVSNFTTSLEGDLTCLSTETRVFCPDRRSRILFTPYWFTIRLVGGLLRRRFLAAVKRSVE